MAFSRRRFRIVISIIIEQVRNYPSPSGLHIVAIALGSNLGDKFHNIELALRLLENDDLCIINTSFLYESAPMYVTDQPTFINCACLAETRLSPPNLLKRLKHIETVVGRVPSVRNGPRAVDLDVILYDDEIMDTRNDKRVELDNLEGELVVPHPRMCEREFVLKPLDDMIPDYIHPSEKKTIHQLLLALPSFSYPLSKVIPFPSSHSSPAGTAPTIITHWTFPADQNSIKIKPKKTHVMATLNTTPDSFSDGAVHSDASAALKYTSDAFSNGASIVDIGGYSTRPGAEFVSVDEEIARVVPFIKAFRAQDTNQALFSVDTFRWQVAEQAIAAGANCINDVYAFSGAESDKTLENESITQMKRVARASAVPVILMHSRGEAGANKDYSAYEYAADGAVLEGVRVELGEKVERIVCGKDGLRRWLVIVDPGVGFSKNLEGNLELLRHASKIAEQIDIGPADNRRRNSLAGYPILIGASRKSFLGVLLAQEPHGRQTAPVERGWATATAVACAVQQGALVVRVHDVDEMVDVVKVADALWSV